MPAFRRAAQVALSLEIWIVGSLVAASFIWMELLPATVIVSLALVILRWLENRGFTSRTPADWGILVLCILPLFSLWLAGAPDYMLVQVLRLYTGVALYYAVLNWTTDERRYTYLTGSYILVGILLGLFALIGVQWATNKLLFIPESLYSRFHLLVTDAANPNVMAGYLVLLLPISTAGILFNDRQTAARRSRVLLLGLSLLGTVVMGLILVLTQSRGALLAYGLSCLILIALRWRWGWLLIPSLGLLGIAAWGYLDSIPTSEYILTSSGRISLNDRLDIWSRAIYIIRDFPFTGVGMGAFGEVVGLFYPFRQVFNEQQIHAHNLFIQIAVDQGLPGLVAWLSVVVALCAGSWHVYRIGRKRSDLWSAGLGAGYLASLAALLLHGLGDAVTWGMVRPAPLTWAIWGGIAAGARLVLVFRENNTESVPE